MKEFYMVEDVVFESYDKAMEYIADNNPELGDDAMVDYAESHIESLNENDVKLCECWDCGGDFYQEKGNRNHYCEKCWR